MFLTLLLRKALCSYHVLNFRMPEGLRSYKLCSYIKKNVYSYKQLSFPQGDHPKFVFGDALPKAIKDISETNKVVRGLILNDQHFQRLSSINRSQIQVILFILGPRPPKGKTLYQSISIIPNKRSKMDSSPDPQTTAIPKEHEYGAIGKLMKCVGRTMIL